MANQILDLLSEKGNTSSLRLVFIICTFLIFFVWAWLSIKNNQFMPFQGDKIGMILTLLGGKEVQKYFENKKTEGGRNDGS